MLAVIFLDCAEPSLLRRLLVQGKLPNLSALGEKGQTIPLSSDALFLDGGVFQTLLTGVNPAKHGMYKFRQLIPGTYRYETVKGSQSPVRHVWSVLSSAGQNCCVFDVPKAHVEAGFNGKLIASWGSYAPAGSPSSSPPELLGELRAKFGKHPLRMYRRLTQSPTGYRRALDDLVEGIHKRVAICKWLLQDDYDVFFTCFSESHTGAHQFWHVDQPSHPLYDERVEKLCGKPVETIYQALDHAIGEILQMLPRDSRVVVMTQQGVRNCYTGNVVLEQWIARRNGVPSNRLGHLKRRLQARFAGSGNWMRDSVVFFMSQSPLKQKLVNLWVSREFQPQTDVFLVGASDYASMLRVNLEGREPDGVVQRTDYQALLEELKADILRFEDPGDGRRLVSEVVLLHDVYRGPLVDNLPDLVVVWSNEKPIDALRCPKYGTFTGNAPLSNQKLSMHTNEGWAVIAGPGVDPGQSPVARCLADMTATFFALAGQSSPDYVEGTPLVEVAPVLAAKK